ncbi:MAG: peptidoglycan-binding protein [Clostridia bacterium]|nr:peptidoglycan-binding protein [Clostridia bacterium]
MLQQALNALGYFAGEADGVCGEFTLSAVKEFSKVHLARLK